MAIILKNVFFHCGRDDNHSNDINDINQQGLLPLAAFVRGDNHKEGMGGEYLVMEVPEPSNFCDEYMFNCHSI